MARSCCFLADGWRLFPHSSSQTCHTSLRSVSPICAKPCYKVLFKLYFTFRDWFCPKHDWLRSGQWVRIWRIFQITFILNPDHCERGVGAPNDDTTSAGSGGSSGSAACVDQFKVWFSSTTARGSTLCHYSPGKCQNVRNTGNAHDFLTEQTKTQGVVYGFTSCRGGCGGIDLWACVRCPESGIQWCCCPVNCIYRWRHNQQLNRICYICKCNSLFCWLDMKPMRFHKYHLYFEAPQKTHKKHIFGDTFCVNGKHRDIFLILSQNDAWDFYSVSMFSANCPDTFLTLGRKRQICADTILILFPIHQEIHPDTIFDTFNCFSCFIV